MKMATVRDLRYRFSAIEAALRQGEEIEIRKRKRVVGRLVPVRQRVRPEARKGRWKIAPGVSPGYAVEVQWALKGRHKSLAAQGSCVAPSGLDISAAQTPRSRAGLCSAGPPGLLSVMFLPELDFEHM